mmetsp:Transcript_31379/g.35843  ORF Transcript_31379/g.35843 Transcript_31379/m.35843 type:complete len:158 (-) Transcript_31379:104-577(-)|eukprot:CAMPEP_0168322320 /NCGR_PEP_ID=MMETSP0213-20121227/2820_1 /TAXON_ID=151035 /ORGANISM="Euplotes harpa, Strain FSP1.4" /LENGTH=157 /DNA_ID=CAMNT_0008324187 /DNA_START=12 /DNA_END=488 /DNA_ORIENTATION=+
MKKRIYALIIAYIIFKSENHYNLATAIMGFVDEYKTLGICALSLSLLSYMHQQGLLAQFGETKKFVKSIYQLFIDSLGYSRDDIQNKAEIKEEIVERKSTNVQLFNFLLQMNYLKSRRQKISRFDKVKQVTRSLSEYKSGSTEMRDRLLTIDEDEKE